MSDSNPVSRTDAQLAEHASEIRRLGKRAFADIVEIGRRLIAAKEIAGHGNWLPWLEREFGWSDSTALRFMRVAELSKSVTLTDLSIDLSALYRLAAPSTPPEVVEAVVALGRRITCEDIVSATSAREVHAQTVYAIHKIVAHPTICDDRREAEAPTMTGADFHRARIRSTADELVRSLAVRDIGEVVAILTDAEREQVRQGLDKFKAVLDETNVVRLPKPN